MGKAVRAGRFAEHSDEWHAFRDGGIGGSDVAAILGLSPWESRFSLWHRKAGNVDRQQENTETRRGHYLEPAIAAWWADQHDELGLRRNVGSFYHSERPWQRVNPDGIVGNGRKRVALFEAKSASESWQWGEPGTDEIPIYYRTQVMWGMDVLGLDRAYVAVITGQLRFSEYVVEYDADEAQLLRESAREFLDSIAANEPPDIDEHSQTYQVIRDLHPDIDGTDIEIPADLAAEYIATRHVLKAAESEEQESRSRIAAAMGSAQRAVINGHPIATRQARNGGTPYVVAARNLPTSIGDAA